MPLCEVAGDQSPHCLLYDELEVEMRGRRGLGERREIARRVADAAQVALRCTTPVVDQEPPVAHTSRTQELPALRVTPEDREWAIARYERCIEEGRAETWWGRTVCGR